MPKRMIRDWTDSLGLDGISADEERMFVRLIMKADDFGRFYAEPRIVRAMCFPLLDTLRTEHVGRWLDALHHRNLIFRYEAKPQGALLAIVNFGQRLNQAKPKFPPPEGESLEWLPLSGNFRETPGTSGLEENRIEGEVEEEKKRNAPSKARALSEQEVIDFAVSLGFPATDGSYLWNSWEAGGWKRGKEPIKDWKAAFRSWVSGGYLPSQKNSKPGKTNKSEGFDF